MIAIKDMEMPSCCLKCTMLIEDIGCLYCCITSNFPRDYEQKIMEDCPLVEIEQSEDCVSREAVIDYIKKSEFGLYNKIDNDEVVNFIKGLPSYFIDAEKGEI